MADISESFRPNALAALQEYYQLASGSTEREGLKGLIIALGSPDIPSFVLPADGRYIDHQTAFTHRGGDFALPQREVILEYSMADAGFSPGIPRENLKPLNVILFISQLMQGSAVMLPMFRTTDAGKTFWVSPMIGMGFNERSHLEIMPSGELLLGRLDIKEMVRPQTMTERAQLLKDYTDELKVLLHFSMLWRSGKMSLQEHRWPPRNGPARQPLGSERYYTLTSTDSEAFNWLPTSAIQRS